MQEIDTEKMPQKVIVHLPSCLEKKSYVSSIIVFSSFNMDC